ncbi:MAG: D-alanyl-D-alanine carboxypeptidase family protein [Oscillospiraceae bacterium]|nr:D-alanyl-D-alanine carboxypeptidase family protein [Oscillospiraceae bacterium]
MKRILIFLLAACLLCGCAAPASPQPDSTQATDAPTVPTSIQTGLVNKDGKTYYINADGSYAKGKVVIDGIDYFFTKTGEEVLVVNPWHFVPYDYSPDLVTFYDFAQYADGNVLDKTCIDPLLKMLEDCQNAGHNVRIVSSYRRQVTQETLYNNKVDYFLNQGYDIEKAREEAGKIIAVPGTSEHQLGLAVDLIDSSYPYLDEGQEKTPAQKWLMEHCWDYGFILRYPNGKTESTGIIYEPWHYRYVGKELAKELQNSGLCLEEYLETLK